MRGAKRRSNAARTAHFAPRALFVIVCALAAPAAQSATRPTNAEIYFRMDNPCPATGEPTGPCKGYVIDRIIPRVCGGADDASNMQWQTIAEAREKNRWDRVGCRRGRKLVLPGEYKPFSEVHAIAEPVPPVEAEPLPP